MVLTATLEVNILEVLLNIAQNWLSISAKTVAGVKFTTILVGEIYFIAGVEVVSFLFVLMFILEFY
jgi:hypothetical protein